MQKKYKSMSYKEFLKYIDKICEHLEIELKHPDDLEENIFFK